LYIYIYGYLINCEYFNNLNGDEYYGEDMYIHIPIPIPNWKSWGFPILIPILSQFGDSSRNGDEFRQYSQERVYLLSLVEAEYIVVGHNCAEIIWIWLKHQLLDYGMKLVNVPLYWDEKIWWFVA